MLIILKERFVDTEGKTGTYREGVQDVTEKLAAKLLKENRAIKFSAAEVEKIEKEKQTRYAGVIEKREALRAAAVEKREKAKKTAIEAYKKTQKKEPPTEPNDSAQKELAELKAELKALKKMAAAAAKIARKRKATKEEKAASVELKKQVAELEKSIKK